MSQPQYDIERFFSLARDMLCIAGIDGFFKRVNPAFTRILGYTPDELLDKPFVDFVHPDDREETLREVDKLAEGSPTLAFENRYLCKDGTYRHLFWTSYPDPDSGLLYAVARDVTELRRLQDQLWKPLRVDLLTGVANRQAFFETLETEWRRYGRLQLPLALLMIGLDRFAEYNEKHGRDGGDECLKAVAKILADRARRPGDIAARFGGERFSVLLGGGMNSTKLADVGEAIRQEIEALVVPHSNPGGDGQTTASIGVAAVVPEPAAAPESLISAAESALAAAKAGGRNRVVEFTPPA